jgi:hypothetical protein
LLSQISASFKKGLVIESRIYLNSYTSLFASEYLNSTENFSYLSIKCDKVSNAIAMSF